MNDFIDPNQTIKRRGRHFRQIEEIECTPDGQYALIRCSDVAVILYRFNLTYPPHSLTYCTFSALSLVNLFGNGIGPVRTEVKAQSPLPSSAPLPHPSGYLTLCYQIPEIYSLRLSLSYVDNHPSQINISDVERWIEEYPNIVHPSKVLILTAWTPLIVVDGMDKSGILKANRLCVLSSSRPSPDPFKFSPGFIPSLISLPEVGLDFPKEGGGRKRRLLQCDLCGCVDIIHWPDLILDLTKKASSKPSYFPRSNRSDSYASEDAAEIGKKAAIEEIMIPPSRRPLKRRSDPLKATNDSITSGKRRRKSLFDDDIEAVDESISHQSSSAAPCDSAQSSRSQALLTPSKTPKSDGDHQLQTLQEEILSLKSRLNEKEKECSTLMRKFDTRFKMELVTRRNWKAQMSQLETKLSNEQKSAMEYESRACEAERILSLYQSALVPLVEIYQSQQSSSSTRNVMNSQRNEGTRRLPSSTTPAFPSSSPSSVLAAFPSSASQAASTHQNDGNTAAFCVVCQTYTADTLLLPCGHLCLCYSHALSMQSDRILRVCPLCKKECQGISRVHR